MPKLKKLSQALGLVDEESEDYSINKTDDNRSSHNSKSLLQVIPLKKMKMKHRDRVKLIEQYQKKSSKENKAKPRQKKDSSPKEEAKDDSVERYLTKYTDDDESALTQDSANLPIAENKKKKEIKVKNKFFSDCSFDETDYQQKEVFQQELIFEKKTIKNVEHLREKVQKKAQFFKNRLDFKNCDQDAKFKKNMQQKLQGLTQFQEVDVIIQLPKVTKGASSYVDAALFLKNTKLENQGGFLSQPKEQDNSQGPKDRKTFYDDLLKKMKSKKAESLTEQVLKECFKKSKLGQEDFLFDLHSQQNQYPQRAKDLNKNYEQQPQKRQESTNHQKEQKYHTEPQRQYIIELKQSNQNTQFPQKTEEPSKGKDIPSQEYQQNILSNNSASEAMEAKQKIKAARKKNKKKARKSFIKNLIEEEAQDSDDGGPNGPQVESNSDDDDNVSSLIDDDNISICSQQQANAHKRFIKDMLDLEDKKFEQMQKKLRQQHDIQEQRLRARMEEAAKRNRKKNSQKKVVVVGQKVEQNVESSEESISNVRNMEKINRLEHQLGVKKTCSSQSIVTSDNNTVKKNTVDIQKLINLQSACLNKPARNGLKCLQKIRFQKKTKK